MTEISDAERAADKFLDAHRYEAGELTVEQRDLMRHAFVMGWLGHITSDREAMRNRFYHLREANDDSE